ncbi:MAG TPA: hypothetical protein VJW55_01685, partial [Candidatus Angelobacter sp.]|nr:hypothetical protein [Candidatus Angelobacter sp.]
KFLALWNAGDQGQTTSSQAMSSNSNSEKTDAEAGWLPLLSNDQVLAWTVEWYRGFCAEPASILKTTHRQIDKYMALTA